LNQAAGNLGGGDIGNVVVFGDDGDVFVGQVTVVKAVANGQHRVSPSVVAFDERLQTSAFYPIVTCEGVKSRKVSVSAHY
jgi:hypothetical protein